MARPFNRWDPGANVDMIVNPGDGPLAITEGDDPRWPKLVKSWLQPVLYANLDWIGYLQELLFEDGASPAKGARVRGYQYMPKNMSFFGADPANGEPRPDDAADTFGGQNYRYINCGHRLGLRGFISTFTGDTLNVDFQTTWGDPTGRNAGDSRGAWTGLVLSLLNAVTGVADHLAYALHGKRLGDVSWEHRGAHVDAPIVAYAPTGSVAGPWNAVNSGQVRLLITGGPPAWTVKTQYWDTGLPGWVDLTSAVVDLRNYAVPGFEDLFLMSGYLFHGATKHFPGAFPTPVPYQDTYFQEISISQFTPFVLDMIDWSTREASEKASWLTGYSTWWDAPAEGRVPAVDILTYPEGTVFGPERLREFDSDERLWAVRFLPDTTATMVGVEDRKLLTISTVSGETQPVCPADSISLGENLPYAYVGRYRFTDLGTWGSERCLVSFGRAGFASAPIANLNGLGITWRPNNDGELVLKYWDGVSGSWLELTAPLRTADYDDRPVDIAFAWTGERGAIVGRPDYQLRILVDGVTLAEVVEPSLVIQGTYASAIGTGNPALRQSFRGLWYGGITFVEAASDNDIRHAFDEPGEGGFSNPSFETAAESGRPGEAESWQWESRQQVGGWADFSAYRDDLAPFRFGRESFEGGWMRGYAWVYQDETARLAATGFTSDDVGRLAWQLDVNANFILTNHSPITWAESQVGENQNSLAGLPDAEIAAAVFNAGIPNFEGTAENFDLWGRTWDAMTWSGPPWIDSWNMVPPCEDTLGPYGGPTGFDGWYDDVFGTNLDPLCTESFEEAWKNDPFSTAGVVLWHPGTASQGKLRGTSLEFPLTIAPNENQLVLVSDTFAAPARFSLPSLDYADIGSLVSDLNAVTAANIPPGLGLEWGYWDRDGEQGLTFGWDGVAVNTLWFGFAALESERFKDARGALGIRSFSPGWNHTGVGIPAWVFPSLPAGVDASDRFLVDTWSFSEYFIASDPYLGLVALEYGQVGAIFDSAVPDPTYLERFTLQGWVAPAAVWIPDLSAVTLNEARFDGGTAPVENFIDTEWPDELYPA